MCAIQTILMLRLEETYLINNIVSLNPEGKLAKMLIVEVKSTSTLSLNHRRI